MNDLNIKTGGNYKVFYVRTDPLNNLIGNGIILDMK